MAGVCVVIGYLYEEKSFNYILELDDVVEIDFHCGHDDDQYQYDGTGIYSYFCSNRLEKLIATYIGHSRGHSNKS